MRILSWQIECTSHFRHFLLTHAVGLKSHALGIDVYLGTLRQHVNLVEGVHHVESLGKHSVLLPHHHVIFLKLLESAVGKLQASRQSVRHDAQSQRAERLSLGNHAPQQVAQHILAHKLLAVAHRDEFDGVGVHRGVVCHSLLNHPCVHTQMAWQFGCRHHRIVGNDDIAGAVVENAYDRPVVHRPSCQVAHALACSLTIEILSAECRQGCAYLYDIADGRQVSYLVVNHLGHVHRDVAAVALSPTVLPEISGHLSYLFDLPL